MPAVWIPKRLVEYSLINVASENMERFVQRCETQYENRIFQAAGAVLESGRKIVMLTGPSASGKTTTAHKLAHALTLRGRTAKVISLDNFYLNKDVYPRLPDGSKDYENIMALDLPCIQKCLKQLIEEDHCDLPVFDFTTESRTEEVQHLEAEGGIVIVEGIHALNPIMTAALPENSCFKIYAGLREEYSDEDGERMLSTRDIRCARRMTRDVRFRGHSPEQTLALWDRVCEGEDRYIKVFKNEANLLIDTAFSYEVCVLAGLMAPMAGLLPAEHNLSNRLNALVGRFSRFETLDPSVIPENSMLLEFYGDKG